MTCTGHCRFRPFFLAGASVLLLSALTACQTTGAGTTSDRSAKIDSILERAAQRSTENGRTGETLSLLERLYNRDPADPSIALRYGSALREAGYPTRAALVIEPLARDEKAENTAAKMEYAAIAAATGDYLTSEDFARQAVVLEPESGRAYHLLGIALDAQGHHKQAEVAFRKALDLWEGNPGTVLNNLGLNLASQGFLDEALDVLRKAQAAAPNRTEIERNLRIVSALQAPMPEGDWAQPPIPARKPDAPVQTG